MISRAELFPDYFNVVGIRDLADRIAINETPKPDSDNPIDISSKKLQSVL